MYVATGLYMGVETLSDILTYLHYSYPAPIYFVYSSVLIYGTLNKFMGQCPGISTSLGL